MLCLRSNVSRRAWINRNANGASAQGHMIRAFPLTPQSQKHKNTACEIQPKKPGDIICKVCYQFQQQSAKHWASPHFTHLWPYLLKGKWFNQCWIAWVLESIAMLATAWFQWTSAQPCPAGMLLTWAEKLPFMPTYAELFLYSWDVQMWHLLVNSVISKIF